MSLDKPMKDGETFGPLLSIPNPDQSNRIENGA